MSSTTTLALLIDHLDLGGAQFHVEALATGMPPPWRVVVGCLRRRGVVGERLRKEGFSVVDFGMEGRIGGGAVRSIRRWLTEEKASLLHTHLFSASLWGRIAAGARGTPRLVVTQHNLWSPRPYKHFLPDRWLALRTDRWIAPSPAVRRSLRRRLGVHNVELIPHGIDLARFKRINARQRAALRSRLGLNPATRAIAFVGRLAPEKEVALLFPALALARRELPNLRLLIAGDGPEEARLRRQAAESGVSAAIHWQGEVTGAGLHELYAATDCVILPGASEGFGLVALEALASGRPVIGAGGSGVADLVAQSRCGATFSPGSVTDLAAQVVGLLSPAIDLDAMEKAAQKGVEEFSREAMLDRTRSLYEEVLATEAPGKRRNRLGMAPAAPGGR